MTKQEERQEEALKLLEEMRSISEVKEALKREIRQESPTAGHISEYRKQLEHYHKELTARKCEALAIIKKMNLDNQQLILCRYFQNYTIKQLSDYTGYTYKWTWERLNNAKQEFIEIYGKEPPALEDHPGRDREALKGSPRAACYKKGSPGKGI